MTDKLDSILSHLVDEISLSLSDTQLGQLVCYAKKLQQLKQHSIVSWDSDARGMEMHFKDAFMTLPDFKPSFFADLGSGGGLPGIIYAVLWPESKGVLIESQKKRCDFMNECLTEMELSKRIHVLHGRSEELAHLPEWREQFDFITARAFAPFPQFIEHALGFVRPGGIIQALRGEKDKNAPEQYQSLLDFFQLKPVWISSYQLTCGTALRWLFLFKKTAASPDRFPRKNNQIIKSLPKFDSRYF